MRDDASAQRGWRTRPRLGVGEQVLLVAMVALLVPFLARLTGVEAGPLAYAVAFTPWFTLGWLVLAVAAAIARAPRALAVSVIVAAVSLAWVAPLFTSDPAVDYDAQGVGPGSTLTVATVNATFGEVDADEVVALVRERGVDLLAVEELTPDSLDALLAAGLADALPSWKATPAEGFGGAGLFSAADIDLELVLDGFVSHTVYATTEVGGQPFTVLVAHPAAPGLFDHEAWSSDLAQLRKVAAETDGPMMIVGDLNATLDHAGLGALEEDGFVDAVDDAGAGFMPTFPEGRLPFPVVAIDHVMARDLEWAASSVETVSLTGADHRALVVTYALD